VVPEEGPWTWDEVAAIIRALMRNEAKLDELLGEEDDDGEEEADA
jgi:hypothetical protein